MLNLSRLILEWLWSGSLGVPWSGSYVLHETGIVAVLALKNPGTYVMGAILGLALKSLHYTFRNARQKILPGTDAISVGSLAQRELER